MGRGDLQQNVGNERIFLLAVKQILRDIMFSEVGK